MWEFRSTITILLRHFRQRIRVSSTCPLLVVNTVDKSFYIYSTRDNETNTDSPIQQVERKNEEDEDEDKKKISKRFGTNGNWFDHSFLNIVSTVEHEVATNENYQKNERNVAQNRTRQKFHKLAMSVTRLLNVRHNYNYIFGHIVARGIRGKYFHNVKAKPKNHFV